MRPHSCAAPAPALLSGSGRVVPAHARRLAGRLSALLTQDVAIVERLNDAQRRLMNANERLWSGLAPDAFGLLYDSADAATIGTSEVAALTRDDRPDSNAMLAALQNVHWRVHRARSSTTRTPARSDAGSRSRWASSPGSSQTRSARPAGAHWRAQEANVHKLARVAA
jgi:hypothetical protein